MWIWFHGTIEAKAVKMFQLIQCSEEMNEKLTVSEITSLPSPSRNVVNELKFYCRYWLSNSICTLVSMEWQTCNVNVFFLTCFISLTHGRQMLDCTRAPICLAGALNFVCDCNVTFRHTFDMLKHRKMITLSTRSMDLELFANCESNVFSSNVFCFVVSSTQISNWNVFVCYCFGFKTDLIEYMCFSLELCGIIRSVLYISFLCTKSDV